MPDSPNLVCDVWDLAQRGDELQGDFPLQQAPRLAEALFDVNGALRYRLRGHVDAHNRPAARLRLDGVVRARCDRCAGPVEIAVEEQVDFYFLADENELARLPIDAAPDEPLLGSHRFDLAALIEEQLILSLPLSPRHDDCALPGQGADEPPLPDDGERQRPFAALAGLKRRTK